jgi:hypothetical protein
VADENQEPRDLTPEVVGLDDERLALIPSESVSRALLKDMPMVNELARDIVWIGWVTGVFLGKIVVLVLPCSPYVCSAAVLYPLLGLACLDLFLYVPFCSVIDVRPPSPRRTVLLSIVHLAVLWYAYSSDNLCPYNFSAHPLQS